MYVPVLVAGHRAHALLVVAIRVLKVHSAQRSAKDRAGAPGDRTANIDRQN